MRWHTVTDLASFARQTLPWLSRDPVVNNVLGTLIQARRNGQLALEPDALFLVGLDEAGDVAAAALQTPPMPMLLSAMPGGAAGELAAFTAKHRPDLPGVNGPVEPAEAFARAFAAATGVGARVVVSQRMFQLSRVDRPSGVPGEARRATPEERDLIVAWSAAFSAEATPHGPRRDPAPSVDSRLASPDRIWLWQVDGQPVSMAWLSDPVAGVVRISAVYTPPSLRGHGYASGVVAAASQHALDQGAATCMLYTDLANPTSNKIYQALGYRPVGDAASWIFTGAG